jgi:hypothetical protein
MLGCWVELTRWLAIFGDGQILRLVSARAKGDKVTCSVVLWKAKTGKEACYCILGRANQGPCLPLTKQTLATNGQNKIWNGQKQRIKIQGNVWSKPMKSSFPKWVICLRISTGITIETIWPVLEINSSIKKYVSNQTFLAFDSEPWRVNFTHLVPWSRQYLPSNICYKCF